MPHDDAPPAPEPVTVELTEALAPPPGRIARARHTALRIIPFLLLIAAGWVLWREFHKLSFDAVAHAMAGWGVLAIALALVLSALSFVLMSVIEWVGLRWTGARVPWRTVVLGSFLANAIAHAIGANLLTAGAIRARTYSRHGGTLTQVAGATVFGAVSFGVGLAALSGAGLLLATRAELDATAITPLVARSLGVVLLIGALSYVALCAVRRRPFTVFGRSVTLPDVWDAIAQLVLGVIDNGVAAAILWVLLPAAGAPSYASFVGAYAVACVAGLVSSVPGGAGVFESAMAALLPSIDPAVLAAAFLGYRLAFYILPLILAALALAVDAIRHHRS